MAREPTRADVQRRVLRVIVLSQALGGIGVALGIAVGALLAEDMLDSKTFTGIPSAVITLGAAAAAIPLGLLAQRRGRRASMVPGLLVAAAGSLVVVVAAGVGSFPLAIVGMVLFGSATAVNLQGRYAAVDLALPAAQGRTIGLVLAATTIGAVSGPNLAPLADRIGMHVRLADLAGPFAFSALAFGLAAGVLAVFLRPDPLLVAGASSSAAGQPHVRVRVGEAMRDLTATAQGRLGVAALAVSHGAMVAVMAMTPVHMHDHGEGLGAIGLVISIHIGGMYAPAPVSGLLVDRIGAPRVVVVGAVTLMAAGVAAAVSPADSVPAMAVSLALLGLGWSFGLVAGSSLITNSVPAPRRAAAQGAGDLVQSGCGGTLGLLAGLVVAGPGYATLAVLSALLAVPLLLLALRVEPPSDERGSGESALTAIGDAGAAS